MSRHRFNRIGQHTFWLSPDSTTDRPALGVVTGKRCSLLVDAGNSPAHVQALYDQLQLHNIAPPSFVALTHWHWDHVFGTSVLDLPTFASEETRRIVTLMADLDWSDWALEQRVADGREIAFCRDMIKAELPDRAALTIRPPEISFSSEVTIDLGGVTCQIILVGGDHAHDSSIVYVPEDKVVFLGDCFYDDLHHGPRRLTTTQLFPLLDRLIAFDATCYVPSHHDEPLSREEMIAEANLLHTIGRTVEQHYPDQELVIAALPEALGRSLTEDDIEIVEAFMEGKYLPIVQSLF